MGRRLPLKREEIKYVHAPQSIYQVGQHNRTTGHGPIGNRAEATDLHIEAMQNKPIDNPKLAAVARIKPGALIFKFVLMWFCAILVLVPVSLASDINWAKSLLERELSSALMRDVKLGKLKWSLGLNGLAVETSTLKVTELSGAPFFYARRSEMCISPLALLHRQLVINHLLAEGSTLQLIKLAPGQWNFEDLLRPGPEIKLIQLSGAKVLLKDLSKGDKNRSMLASNLELKFNWPRPGKKAPIFLSFDYPTKNYTSKITFESFGTGMLSKWQENNYSFTVGGKKVSPADVDRCLDLICDVQSSLTAPVSPTAKKSASTQAPVAGDTADNVRTAKTVTATKTTAAAARKSSQRTEASKARTTGGTSAATTTSTVKAELNQIASAIGTKARPVVESFDGLFNFNVEGAGVFNNGLKAHVTADIEGLSLSNPVFGHVNAGDTKGSVEVNLTRDKLTWKNMSAKLKGVEFRSTGELKEWETWQSGTSKLNADITAEMADIKALTGLVTPTTSATPVPGVVSKRPQDFLGSINPTKLSGKADLEIKIEGTPRDTRLLTKIKTNDLVVKDVLSDACNQFPLLGIVGITQDTKIKGDIRVVNDEKIEIVDGELRSPCAVVKATGWIDVPTGRSKIDVVADKVSLKQTGIAIGTSDVAFKTVQGTFKLPGRTSLVMDGTASAKATILTEGGNQFLTARINLDNAGLYLKDRSLRLSGVSGDMDINCRNGSGSINFEKIHGRIGDGNFEMHGKALLSAAPTVDLQFHANSFELKHLSDLLNILQVKAPVLTEQQLYGKVKDVVLRATGSSSKPNIYFSAVPEDEYYQPPGLDKPLRATAGLMVYENDTLELKDVALVSRGNTMVTSLTIDQVSTRSILRRVKAKSQGIELSDVHYYLSSAAMPGPLRKAYLDILGEYHLSDPHGKVYGDILCLFGENNDIRLDGILGCFKAGATVMSFPVEGLEGIFAASGEDLLLQDLSGFVRSSKFSADGYIKNYRTKKPTWHTDVTATVAPREMTELIPALSPELKASQMKIDCSQPLSLRTKIQGTFGSNKLQFSLIANKDDEMRVTGPFGHLYQPADTPLTLDGLVMVDPKKIVLGDTHLLLGDALINAKGTINWEDQEPDEHGEMPPKGVPGVNLTFSIPQAANIGTIVSLLDPQASKGISGLMHGSLSVAGKLDNLDPEGKMMLTKVNIPSLHVSNLNGCIDGSGKQSDSDALASQLLSIKDSDDQVEFASARTELLEGRQFISGSPELGSQTSRERQNGVKGEVILGNLILDSVTLRQLTVKDVKARLSVKVPSGKSPSPRIEVENGECKLANGSLHFDGWMDFSRGGTAAVKAIIDGASASILTDKLMGQPGQITGVTHALLDLKTHGGQYEQLINNVEGHVSILVKDGNLSKFGQFQNKVTQYNLLTQGIFGFNFNNLLQSVWPVKSGKFDSFTNEFRIKDGVLSVEELRYQANDMRIWGSGSANLQNNKVSLEVAGRVPRVTSSVIGGPMGSVSKNVTLQKFMKIVTMGKLESLPSLPVLGDIAADKPRTFTFSVSAPIDDPKLMAKSIEKSFKWLPNKPAATAHPVPGLY